MRGSYDKTKYGYPTLIDHQIPDHKSLHDLDDIYTLMNWDRIESILVPIYASKDGPSSYPAIIMFRALLLQSWHNLSNVMLSKMLGRDLLFKRFSGFSIVDQIPDHSTFSRFKGMLKIGNKVNKRAYRNHPLSDDEQTINQTVSRIKYVVERTFGVLKRHYGLQKRSYLVV